MEQKTNDEQLIIRYLLGDLSEEEHAQVEDRFFADDEFFERLQMVKDELMDAYAQGHLSEPECARFESHFLRSPHHQHEVALSHTLINTVTKASIATASSTITQPQPISWWQSFREFLNAQSSMFRLSLATAALAVVIGGTWLVTQTMQMRSQLAQLQTERQSWQQRVQTLEQQIAQQQTDRHDLTQQLDQAKNELARLEQQLAQTPSPTNILSFSLFPISRLRSEGDKPKLITIPAGTPSVKLDLIFEPEDEFASYRVELRRRGEEQVLQRWDRRRAQSTNRGSTITINVPGKLLPAGDYRVTLTGIGVDGSSDAIADYDFKSLIRQ